MKRIIYTIALLGCLSLAACSGDDYSEELSQRQQKPIVEDTDNETSPSGTTKAYNYKNIVTIEMGEAYGTLKEKLGDNLSTADKLIITGSIDANDVQTFLHEMPALVALDLTAVTFKETDDKFEIIDHAGMVCEYSLVNNEITTDMFYRQNKLIEIALPKTVTKIHESAFSYCSSLETITFPDNLKTIGEDAFSNCEKLLKLTLPSGLTEIGEKAFSRCDALTSIELPESLTSIGGFAFYYCKDLTSIKIPQNVKTINTSTFEWCSKLTSIEMPSVTTIGTKAFYYCQALESVTFSQDPKLETIGNNAFEYCEALSSFEFPASLTSIGEGAFVHCSSLETVTIPDAFETLPNNAFDGCQKLKSVTFSQNSKLKTIGNHVFNSCKALPSIEFPASLTSIGEGTFRYCSSLEKISLPNGIQEVSKSLFSECTSLKTVHLPEGLKKIGDEAFASCDALISIELPSSLEEIGIGAFSSSGLTNIDLTKSNLTTIGSKAFSSSKLTTIDFPASFTSIPSSCFDSCKKLTTVKLHEGLVSIGERAFYDCQSLTDVTIPSTLKSIDNGAFSGCSLLPSIQMNEGLLSLGDEAFYTCKNLGTIKFPQTLEKIGRYCFYNCENLTFEDPHLPELTSIGEAVFKDSHSIKSIVFPGSLTSLPNNVCENCKSLESVTISEDCKSIGNSAFRIDNSDYNKLKEINLPSSLVSIGECAFENRKLTSLDFLNEKLTKLTTIGNYAFKGCDINGDVTFPPNIQSVGDYTFSGNTSITSIHLTNPSGQVTLGDLFGKQVNCLVYAKNCNVDSHKNLPNVIPNNNIIASLILTEGSSFHCPEEFTALRVTFTKQFNLPRYGYANMVKGKASNWYGLTLPFKVDKITTADGRTFAPFGATDGDSKPFWLRKLSSSGSFAFENQTSIEAGEPYIIAFPNSDEYKDEYNVVGDVTFSGGKITIPQTEEYEIISGEGFSMKRNYKELPKSSSIYLLNSPRYGDYRDGEKGDYDWGSHFIRSLRDSWAFEAYVTTTSGASAISLDQGMPNTRSLRPLGPVPSVDDM